MMMSRRQMVLGGLLGLTGAAAHAFVPRQEMDLLGNRKLEALVPKKIGPWEFMSKSGLIIPPSDQLSDQLYSQLLTRVYVSEEQLPIMLLIAQSPAQDGVLQVHRPEVCYPAGGYALSESYLHQINLSGRGSIPSRVFTASSSDRIEQLLYWTRIGDALPTTWFDQRMAVAKANLSGQIPDGVLVRISTISPERSSIAVLDQFAMALINSIPVSAKSVLVGNATYGVAR